MSRVRSIGLFLLAAAVLPLGTACGSGQVAATALDVSAVEGANVHRGGLDLLNVRIANPPTGSYPSGGNAPLYATITTDYHTTDTLLAVRTDAASGV
ncbi:MAG: hypothetical protein ABJA34_11525, partial [Pseudonocardiales bacterium]